MAKTREKHVSAFVTEEELAEINAAARQHHQSVSAFLRAAMCECAEIRPFFTDDDRLLIAYLRQELQREGSNLTALLIALNRNQYFDDAEIKASILAMQRAIAGLSVELLRRTNPPRSYRSGGKNV